MNLSVTIATAFAAEIVILEMEEELLEKVELLLKGVRRKNELVIQAESVGLA